MTQAAQIEEQPTDVIKPNVEGDQSPNSATEQVDKSPADEGQEKINARFGKITAEKWEQKRRADALEQQLAELQQAPTKPEEAPTLEQYEFDDAKYQSALIQHEVKKGVAEGKAELRKEQQREQAKQKQSNATHAFNSKVAEFSMSTPDYADVIGGMPDLPVDIAQAVMTMEKGPEVAYYLGQHPDVANQIASKDYMSAAIQLGAIQANLSQTKTVKPSNAPEPQDTLGGGGAPPQERGPSGATYE